MFKDVEIKTTNGLKNFHNSVSNELKQNLMNHYSLLCVCKVFPSKSQSKLSGITSEYSAWLTFAYSDRDLQQEVFQHHGELQHTPQCPPSALNTLMISYCLDRHKQMPCIPSLSRRTQECVWLCVCKWGRERETALTEGLCKTLRPHLTDSWHVC